MIYFLDSVRQLKEKIVAFSDIAHLIIVFIGLIVFLVIYRFITSSYRCGTVSEASKLETLWTIGPCFVLLTLAIPSLFLLYIRDCPGESKARIRVIGRQWYWVYGTNERYIEQNSDHRCFECSNPSTIKTGLRTLALISSGDVLHSWALPTLGIKVDAVPGRLNSIRVQSKYPGVFYGQCREICGANHRFIPIKLESIYVSRC